MVQAPDGPALILNFDLRKTGASMIQGMSGMVSTMALRLPRSVTWTMSACCRSDFDGAESAQTVVGLRRCGFALVTGKPGFTALLRVLGRNMR